MKNNDLGALWLKTGKDNKNYMSGVIDGKHVVVFKNTMKQKESQPDYIVLESKLEHSNNQKKSYNKQENDIFINDEDIPF